MKSAQEWQKEFWTVGHTKPFIDTVTAIQTDARADLLDQLSKAQAQLKEVLLLAHHKRGIFTLEHDEFNKRRDAFLAEQKPNLKN